MNRTWSLRAFKKLLHENGYERVRGGGHLIYSNGKRTISITSNKINRMVAQRLIKENNLEVKE